MTSAPPVNILFTSAGRRVSLIRCFRESMHRLGLGGKIFAADAKRDAPALFVADEKVQLPLLSNPEYFVRLQEFCRDYRIDLVVPLIDPELVLLCRHRDKFSDQGTKLLVCSEETNRICEDKRNTAEFFRQCGIATPKLFTIEEAEQNHDWQKPLILKPASGSGSAGVTCITSVEELRFFWKYLRDPIIQQRMEGEEYTIDVLVDSAQRAICAVPRLRIETRAGEISKGVTCKHRPIMEAARVVAEQLPGAVGCLTIQCFWDEKQQIPYFTEINPRFGGGYPLSYTAGADYPGWILANLRGHNFPIKFDGWREDVAMLRYDAAIFTMRDELQ